MRQISHWSWPGFSLYNHPLYSISIEEIKKPPWPFCLGFTLLINIDTCHPVTMLHIWWHRNIWHLTVIKLLFMCFSLYAFFHWRDVGHHSFFLFLFLFFFVFFFSPKASLLKGICVQAITSLGENNLANRKKWEQIHAYRQSVIFCALSSAKIMLTDQTSVPRYFVKTFQQVSFCLKMKSSLLTVASRTILGGLCCNCIRMKTTKSNIFVYFNKNSVTDNVLIVAVKTLTQEPSLPLSGHPKTQQWMTEKCMPCTPSAPADMANG